MLQVTRDNGSTGRGISAAEPTDIGPGSTVTGLDEEELAVLCEVGHHWGRALGRRRAVVHALPIDPSLHRFPHALRPRRGDRFPPVYFIETDDPAEVVATAHAGAGTSRSGRAASTWRRVLLGAPLSGSAVAHERMRKPVALAILSSDALSSVAYGPEAMLAVLALAGSGALGLSLEISAAIVVLMIAVGLSYRQLIKAYPHGGGSYIVAARNLGELPALIVAGALMTEYVLTVAVSISAGVAAITSAVPGLAHYAVPLGLAAIALLLTGNLRGVRQAGAIFSAPTYAFVLAIFAMIAVGLVDASGRGFTPTPVVGLEPIEGITVLLVVRAFSSGATAMTGIEAISNAVPAFQPPASRNSRTVLALMVGLLVAMFAGLVVLMHLDGIVPHSGQTALSELAHRSFGSGPLYVYVQVATALVLLLAANTSFNGFPRLLSIMARNGHAPRLFLRLGDRLAFSNGTIALAVAAAVLLAVFAGHTHTLIPLYAVGVFVAFTFSQVGMVVHWWRRRDEHWRRSMLLNGVGATLSALVFVIAAVTKFSQGAWVALLLIALLVLLAWRIRCHYDGVRRALALYPLEHSAPDHPILPTRLNAPDGNTPPFPRAEDDESPDQLQHLVVVPIVRLDLSSLRALAYAASLGQPVLAVHISPDDDEAARFKSYWAAWGDHLPLEVVDSPYRALVPPLARYIDALRTQRSELTLTVVLPELIVRHRWQQLLHNGTARRLRRVLRHQPGVVTTTIPLHLST
ncbi:MAG: APC family permease [Thermoleophilaceae bacterium]